MVGGCPQASGVGGGWLFRERSLHCDVLSHLPAEAFCYPPAAVRRSLREPVLRSGLTWPRVSGRVPIVQGPGPLAGVRGQLSR